VNCDRIQALLSDRLGGEHLDAPTAERVDDHAAGCVRCSAFLDASQRARVALRIRPADRVPDLVDPIMQAIRNEGRGPARIAYDPRGGSRRPWGLVAAVVVGALVGSLLVGGPVRPPDRGPTAIAAVIRGVRAAAPSLDAFRATYTIHESDPASEVPSRSLEMDVAFLAPQRFRLEISDLTEYPSAAWTPTDILYVEDAPATYVEGPTGCPAELGPGVCPATRTTVTTSSEYAAAAPLPADLILPLATFGSAQGIEVIGPDVVEGRPATQVEMTFARATPLFPFLRLGGSWRPYFPGDRVRLWLDTASWLPLRFAVWPSSDPERASWSMRFGRAVEPVDEPILDVRLVGVEGSRPDPSLFAIPGVAAAESLPLPALAARAGFLPNTPTAPGDLRLSEALLPSSPGAAAPASLLVYTDGLDYLRIAEDPGWTGPGPFGPVDATAQAVRLGGVGVGVYEPAGDGLGRRLAIHGEQTDLFLESNLPRDRLLSIAASLTLRGRPLPRSWRVNGSGGVRLARVGIERAASVAGLDPFPSILPEGYVVASAWIERVAGTPTSVTIRLRQRDMDEAGPPLTLHVEPGGAFPIATSAGQVRVRFGPFEGRWTPTDQQLGWEADGGYRSLTGSLDLSSMVTVAIAISGVAP
jgi:hypothetical protein